MKISKKTYFMMAALSAFLAGAPNEGKCAEASMPSVKTQMKSVELAAEADFKEALEAAKKDGKIVMLEFTGKDWCPPCKMLHKFVLETEEFAKYAKEKLHVVVADFDRMGEPKLKEQAKNYKNLANQYQLEGFPTIILIEPNSAMTETIVGLQVQSPKELADRIDSFKARATKQK